jgi:hypothetical protein
MCGHASKLARDARDSLTNKVWASKINYRYITSLINVYRYDHVLINKGGLFLCHMIISLDHYWLMSM